jgi:nitrate reductase assembly molybdenum cofactor insertion protein NarJ
MGLPDVSEIAAACEDASARRLLTQAQSNWGLLAERLEAMITPEPQ